jgi:mandelamide amidase
VARCVADLQLFDRVASGERSAEPVALAGVRLAVGREYWFADLHPEVERLAALALRRLEAAGAELIEVDVPDLARLISLTTSPIQSHDFSPSVAGYLERHRAESVWMRGLRRPSGPARAGGVRPRAARIVPLRVPTGRRATSPPRSCTRGVAAVVHSGGAHAIVSATLVPAPRVGKATALQCAGRRTLQCRDL